MRLAAVTLTNFRAYRGPTRIEVGDLTALIGRNDVGKSSVLEALDFFFNGKDARSKFDAGDCCVANRRGVVGIECEFDELPTDLVLDSSATTTLAAEYLLHSDGRLYVVKQWRCDLATPKEEVYIRAAHPQANNYADLLQLTQRELRTRLAELGVNTEGVNQSVNPSMRAAIWANCDDLQLGETLLPVDKADGKAIWTKIELLLPLYALFQSDRPSRDSDSEVQDPMKLAIAAALAEENIQTLLQQVVEAVRTKAVDLAERTHRTLAKMDPDLAGQLTPTFRSDPKWSGIFSLALDGDDGIPVNKRGSGVRRLILVSFFRAEAERRLAEAVSSSIIYAIEEPETSQHPLSQKLLLEALEGLADEPGVQVLLSTHSPGLANWLPLTSFRYLRRDEDGVPIVEQGSDAVYDDVANALGVVPDSRVQVLLCVEGPNDVTALRHLSHALHLADPNVPDLSNDPRVAVLPLGGSSLSNWVAEHHLRALNKPEVHIYDGDVNHANELSRVNARGDGSWAVQTTKQEIENYLHPDAIRVGLGVSVTFGDNDDVPSLVGAALQPPLKDSKTKKRLAADAFPHMTAARLKQRDPNDEILGWLRRLAGML